MSEGDAEQKPSSLPEGFVKHQYRPGQSGNPGGRPKGSVDLWARIDKRLLTRAKDGRELADLVADIVVRELLKANGRILTIALKRAFKETVSPDDMAADIRAALAEMRLTVPPPNELS